MEKYFNLEKILKAPPAGSPTCIVHADVTLARSKVKVKVTGLLNFRKLPKVAL